MHDDSRIEAAISYLRERVTRAPSVVIILGSGLSGVADEIADPLRIPYEEIPGFPRATVVGHDGMLILGVWAGVEVAVMRGRFHFYEGWGPTDVAVPLRVLRALGADRLVVTNAAGAIRTDLGAGDLMLITDHLDMMFRGPLVAGPGPESGGDLIGRLGEAPYDGGAGAVVREVAGRMGFRLQSGVYAGVLGPNFETPAEIEMLRRLGADAVGMSTVPEVVIARSLGMRVLGISCITNDAPGAGRPKLTHTEVLDVAGRASERLTGLVREALPGFASLNLPTEAAE